MTFENVLDFLRYLNRTGEVVRIGRPVGVEDLDHASQTALFGSKMGSSR